MAALACTLALTVCFRFALPLTVATAHIVVGILMTRLTTPALILTTLTPALTLLALRRQRPNVREILRPAAFLFNLLSTLMPMP